MEKEKVKPVGIRHTVKKERESRRSTESPREAWLVEFSCGHTQKVVAYTFGEVEKAPEVGEDLHCKICDEIVEIIGIQKRSYKEGKHF